MIGKSGNNEGGKKADEIASLDAIDNIFIQGAADSQLSFDNVTHTHADGDVLTGIGIYASNSLEAIYTRGDLTMTQIMQMTSGVTD